MSVALAERSMKLIGVGFGNLISAERVISIVGYESAPVKRMVQDAREKGLLIDASFGRSTRAVIVMDSGNIVLSALTPAALAERLNEKSLTGGRQDDE